MADKEEREAVIFGYSGRFGHFLRAEASVSALSYPVPPRTALLGTIGAVLGLEKDAPQVELADALISVAGPIPQTHWHRVKLRKDPPTPLPRRVKKGAKGSSAPEKATLIRQEWLFNPSYTVTACLPVGYHDELVSRLRKGHWHYSPCLGLSEMPARLEYLEEGAASPLPSDSEVHCTSVARGNSTTINGRETLKVSANGDPLAILPLRMPREVTVDRVFTHEDYIVERSGLPMPLRADDAYEISSATGTTVVIFL